jgi:hypothetical protein
LAEFRYRAYISYSHADERWAAWLQHALESYRVPRRLAARADGGTLPRRIAPVFRDREDLSTAHSLSDSLVAALRASEALIVVCSPAAASSRWVNEEVRQFQALGRANRVLCMIVDGDPAAPIGQGGCFPPALFDGVQDADAEPLAADPRDFADGRKLARLKVVAGLLGVRLDELRQRDLRHRRRWLAAGALAVAAALALLAVTVTSRIAQQQERDKAERMATFIVDLGEDLRSELDLESLGRISARAMAYLEDLDPGKLSRETSIRLGLALRQLGLVNSQQGKSAESLAAFERSRHLFQGLMDKYPARNDVLFELGQAEFYVGNYYYEMGDPDSAWIPWNNYYEISRILYSSDPADRKWLLELSYASMNLILLRVLSERTVDEQLLEDVTRTVNLAEQALAAWPGNSEVLAHYSNTLAWAADAQYKACNLVAALHYRQLTLNQAERAAAGDPSNKALQRSEAYRHSGLAKVLTDLGQFEGVERHRQVSLDILTRLRAMDPSNKLLSTEVAANQRLLADLMRDTGRLESALALMQQAEPGLRPAKSLDRVSESRLEEYSQLLLSYAELRRRAGEREESARLLSKVLEIVTARQEQGRMSRDDRDRIAELRYLWWELEGADLAEQYPYMQSVSREAASPYRSCHDAELNAKLAVVRGDREAARLQADYLAERGYRHPGYLHFCRTHGLCAP